VPSKVNNKTLRNVFFVPLLLAAALVAACGKPAGYALTEQDEPAYNQGQSLLRENRLDAALLAVANGVDSRRDAAESHLELGRIYMKHVGDPVSAIYHFRKYLELRPNAEMSRQVLQLIESAKKDFARTLPGDPLGPGIERVDLMEQLAQARQQNEQLRRRVAELEAQAGIVRTPPALTQAVQPGAPPLPAAPTGAQPVAAAAPPGKYVVQSGDTLSKISQTVYGTSVRWRDIFDANRDQLKSPHDLKVGMELKIPGGR